LVEVPVRVTVAKDTFESMLPGFVHGVPPPVLVPVDVEDATEPVEASVADA
jgi:hypothetical protein